MKDDLGKCPINVMLLFQQHSTKVSRGHMSKTRVTRVCILAKMTLETPEFLRIDIGHYLHSWSVIKITQSSHEILIWLESADEWPHRGRVASVTSSSIHGAASGATDLLSTKLTRIHEIFLFNVHLSFTHSRNNLIQETTYQGWKTVLLAQFISFCYCSLLRFLGLASMHGSSIVAGEVPYHVHQLECSNLSNLINNSFRWNWVNKSVVMKSLSTKEKCLK